MPLFIQKQTVRHEMMSEWKRKPQKKCVLTSLGRCCKDLQSCCGFAQQICGAEVAKQVSSSKYCCWFLLLHRCRNLETATGTGDAMRRSCWCVCWSVVIRVLTSANKWRKRGLTASPKLTCPVALTAPRKIFSIVLVVAAVDVAVVVVVGAIPCVCFVRQKRNG